MEPTFYPDGFDTLDRGIDSGRRPLLIGRDTASYASNFTFRDGLGSTRPPFQRVDLEFGGDDDAEDAFSAGESRFQGVSPYEPDNGDGFLVLSIGGKLYRVNVGPPTASVQDVSPDDEGNSPGRLMAWGVQGEIWQVWQDGQSTPIFFNGAGSRRANKNEIKTGCMGAYGHGRFWFANPDLRSFRAYDIVRGSSGTASYRQRDAVLKDTENTFLQEGGDFTVPGTNGPIGAMQFVSVLDKSTGQGPLQVFTSKGVFSCNAPTDRTTWKDLTYPIETISLINYGALGQNSTIPINGDVFYRSIDGIRSFIVAIRNFRQWGNTPLSTEMNRTLRHDSKQLLPFGSAVLFDNRFLCTVSPVMGNLGVHHRGLAVMDLTHISSMGTTSPPVWEGAWSGLNILAISKVEIASDERCFAVVLGADNDIQIWELLKEGITDTGSDGIPWAIETGSLDFKHPVTLKKLTQGILQVMEMQGEVTFTVKWRPDQYAGWRDWKTFVECAATPNCDDSNCSFLRPLQPQFRPRLGLGVPPSGCDEVNKRPFEHFYDAQFRIEGIGKATLKRFIALVEPRRETLYTDCSPTSPVCKELELCPTQDFE